MKKTLIAFLAMAALGAVFGAGLGPRNYVQDGLVTQFDGIDNAGTGVHDPAASKWVDLKGKASISLAGTAAFGACWLDSGTTGQTISSMPSLKSNPITIDFPVNLIDIKTTSTSTTWPALLSNNYAYFHSTGLKDTTTTIPRSFRFYVDKTEDRPYVNGVYTNTICGISDAKNIRVFKDGVQSGTCTSKVAKVMSDWGLNYGNVSTYVRAHYFALRVYNRGLTDDEVYLNSLIDSLRYIGAHHTGTGADVNWSAIPWVNSYGDSVTPSTATNSCATVANAAVKVATTDVVGLRGLSLEDGATLDVAEGGVVSLRFLFVEGQEIPRGIYSGNAALGQTATWLTGGGVVRVADSRTVGIPFEHVAGDADGWVTFGLPSSQGGAYGYGKGCRASKPASTYHWIVADHPIWENYAFSQDAKLRLVGYVMLEQIPVGMFSEVDLSQAEYILLHVGQPYADGSPFVIPSSLQNVRFQPGTWVEELGTNYLTSADSGTITSDIECNGTFRVYGDGTQLAAQQVTGDFTGTGKIKLGNYSKQLRLSGEVLFTGNVTGYENGHLVWFDSLNVAGTRLGDVTFNSCGSTYHTNATHCADGLLFGKHNSDQRADGELYVKSIAGNARDVTDKNGKRWRCGGEVVVWGGNTVRIGELIGALHVVGNVKDQNCTCNYFASAVSKGIGNFAADKVSSTGDLFLSTNINVTAGSVTGGVRFNYTYQSNVVNRMTLDITNSCVTSARLYATDLQMLPARVSGFTGTVTLRDVAAAKFQNATYAMTVDFDKELYTTDGCIGSGTLSAAPASGTVNVTLAGTPKKGEYSLFRFDSAVDAGGRSLFADWTVNIVGHEGERQPMVGEGENMKVVTIMKNSTGLWLKVSNSGFRVILR